MISCIVSEKIANEERSLLREFPLTIRAAFAEFGPRTTIDGILIHPIIAGPEFDVPRTEKISYSRKDKGIRIWMTLDHSAWERSDLNGKADLMVQSIGQALDMISNKRLPAGTKTEIMAIIGACKKSVLQKLRLLH